MELFRQTNIDFLRWKWWAIGASWALILVGLLAIFVQKGLKFGIDFAGGTQIALRFAARPDIDHLRKLLDAGHFGDTGIQRYEAAEKNEVLIRVQQQKKEGRDITAEVLTLLRQGVGSAADPSKIDLNTQGRDSLAGRLTAADPEHVAGKSGQTPAEHYGRIAEQVIARRSEIGVFRSPSDVATVLGLSSEVKAWLQSNAVTGPFVLLSAENVGPQVGADLRQKALWAVATSIVGMLIYIAWRFRSFPFGVGAVVALIHDTLSRTVLTSGATMLVVVALFFLGGEVLNTFALTLIIGIVIGTYSSIYVASPIVVIWKQWTSRRRLVPVPAARPTTPAPVPPSQKKKSGRR